MISRFLAPTPPLPVVPDPQPVGSNPPLVAEKRIKPEKQPVKIEHSKNMHTLFWSFLFTL